MTAQELRKRYIDFFAAQGHKLLPNVSLVPENDPTALFVSAGMHPLVPYLLGEKHPLGKRLVGVQRCLRTGDIDEVGDIVHHTFFEMLGNWSLGDYWKKEAISWSFEFLTSEKWLGVKKERLAVSVFAGGRDASFDQESYDLWRDLGLPESRIAKLSKSDNWWGPVGETGPCGPDTEMFVWVGKSTPPEDFDPKNPHWVEVWNDVFMEYNKTAKGKYEPLKQKNVDTGMGLERMMVVLNGFDDDYQTELFTPIILEVEKVSGKKYTDYQKEMRIIADHTKAAVFLIADGVVPGNVGQGYILRRLIRRAVRRGKQLKIENLFVFSVVEALINTYKKEYPQMEKTRKFILSTLTDEEQKFQKPLNWVEQYHNDLEQAVANKIIKRIKDIPILSSPKVASGAYVYENYQTYGVPPDLSQEVIEELGLGFDKGEYDKVFEKHQELSRSTSSGMFKGGLAEDTRETTKYHTATHLLQASLRQILGIHVQQKGSNITAKRLRFDFSHQEKLTEEEIRKVEELVNQKIGQNLPVKMGITTLDEAKKKGVLALFSDRYEEKVKVFTIGDFSKEVCGGPHVDFTGDLGRFKITKEESAGSGIRRVYAILE